MAAEYEDGQTVSVSAFDGLVLTNGEINVHHGGDYSVKIIEGADTIEIEVENGTLKIGCKKPCKWGSRHKVEVTAGALENIVIAGGGKIAAHGDFPEVDDLNVVITGGGEIDARAVPGRSVDAAITGGGKLTVTASENLDAAIIGGGEIEYYGDPKVSKSIIGGGVIRQK